ncbi:MAG: hypothetical protein ACP5I6_01080 [Caldisphaera sp.]|nr:hypothetical protein [Caldisphaera sp.]PMP59426.1 MAG: hypothetical protein C0201_04850 [Caldisphaera sp.]
MSERIPVGGPFRAAIGLHEQVNADSIRDSRRLWGLYCSNDNKLCEKFYEIIYELSNYIAEMRIEDINYEDYKGIDREFFAKLNKIKSDYASYLSGEIISFGEYVLVKANKDLILLNNKFIERGEMTLVLLEEAILLSALGNVSLIKSLSSHMIAKR